MIHDISKSIYKTRESISVLDDTRTTNMLGPAGVGLSKERPEDVVSNRAKFSIAAKIIDMIYGNNLKVYVTEETINLETEKTILFSFVYDKVNYIGQVRYTEVMGDEALVSAYWQNATIPTFASILASFIVSAELSEEIKQALIGIKVELQKKEKKNMDEIERNVLLCCDAFYYGFIRTGKLSKIKNFEEAFEDYLLTKSIESKIAIPAEYMMDNGNRRRKEAEKKQEIDIESCNVPYQWAEDQQAYIPHGSNYVMTPTAEKLIKKISFRANKIIERMNQGKQGIEAIENDYMNVLLCGRPGSGKTKMANAIAEKLNMPIYTIPFSKNTEEDTVEGKNKVVNGKIDFVETDFIKAYQNGGIVVLEEINLADPAVVMGSLGQAIEFPFVIMKDGYIPVRRHPLCVIIATMNTGTAGSKSLNEALSSRFKQTYILEDPERDLFIDILASKGFTKKTSRWVYSAYQRVLNALRAPGTGGEECASTITLRSCIGALECIEEGSEPKDAIRDTMIGKIAERDLELAKKIEEEVVDSLSERI